MIARQAEKQKHFYKLFDFLRNAKYEKAKKIRENILAEEFLAAKSRLDTIRKAIEFADERETKEYFIYRLKAAELDFSRHLKLAKNNNLSIPFLKENEL